MDVNEQPLATQDPRNENTRAVLRVWIPRLPRTANPLLVDRIYLCAKNPYGVSPRKRAIFIFLMHRLYLTQRGEGAFTFQR